MKKKATTLPKIVILLLALLAAAATANAEVRFLLFSDGSASWRDRVESIESQGGKLRHGFPGGGAIVDAPAAAWEKSLSRESNGWTVYAGSVDAARMETLARRAHTAAFAWNRRFEAAPAPAKAPTPDFRLPVHEGVEDAGYPPRGIGPAGKVPAGANFYDTSEFMLGEVAVAILFPESNGAIDPSTEDWTQGLLDTMVAEALNGLDWWLQHAPGGELSFVYEIPDPIPTPYEPINRGAFTYARVETLWVAGLFDTLGYTSGNAFYKARDYLNDVRETYDTDWAVSVILVNSENDPDGRFAAPYYTYAYSYFGGPYFCTTSDAGPNGTENLDSIIGHEVAHSFYALDEYTGGSLSCFAMAGYEQVPNQNKEGGCAIDEGCIMKRWVSGLAGDSLCIYTRGQIGMSDADSDDIANILDTYPTSLLDPLADTLGYYTPTVTGSAFVNPLPNLNTAGEGHDITLNTIASVEYRIDGGDWTAAAAKDGTFDGHGEAFTFTTPELSEATHLIETRAVNSVANAETTYAAATVTIYDGVAPGQVSDLAAAAYDSNAVLTWLNPPDADLQTVMIRYSTIAFPADTLEGTLLEVRPAAPLARDTVDVAGLLPDTVYYFSLFTMDEVPQPSPPAEVTATPLYPPPPDQLHLPLAGSLYTSHLPQLVWSPATPVDPLDTLVAYGVQVATDSNFANVVLDVEAATGAPADTFYAAAESLAAGLPHWWRVRGKDKLTNTYGYWSDPSWFVTELPLLAVEFVDSTESSWSNFASGDTLAPLLDARVEVRFQPADTLGIAGYSGWLHWMSAAWDSVPLAFDRNEGGFGYWQASLPYGTAFGRGDLVQFYVSGKDPNNAALVADKGGEYYSFVAGQNPLVSHHLPASVEPGAATMRDPLHVVDSDPSFAVSVGTTPAGAITGGEVRYHVQGDTLFASVPLVFDTLAGTDDYYSAAVESSFVFDATVEYYLKVWGGDDFDTTYVYGGNDVSFTSLAPADALGDPFSFVVASATGVTGGQIAAIPERNTLRSNAPNPFNPTTTISFGLARGGEVRLEVYDIAGRRVATLVNGRRDAGWHEAVWDGRSSSGAAAASGVYFYRIAAEAWTETRRMILIR